jgi:CysZ protein
MSHVPDWLQWLNYLLWPMVVISILLVFGYFLDHRQLDCRAV